MLVETDRQLTLVAPDGSPLLVAHGEVLLADGRLLTTRDASVSWAIDHTRSVVQLVFRNQSNQTLRVEQLRPLVARAGFRGLPLANLLVSQTGWQSWSRAYPPAPFESNLTTDGPPIRGPRLPRRQPDSQVVPWMVVLQQTDAPDALLLGFLSAQHQLGTIEIIPSHAAHALVAATELEGVEVAPGAELRSEPLLLSHGHDPRALVAQYARAAATAMHARPVREVLSGWCSWYQLYTTVSEADVRRNLALLSARRDELPLPLIQLDDGFQREVGDWLELNDKFPSGMPALVGSIRQHGFRAGLWLAPFLLSARSRTFAEHPDWVVRDEHGAPMVGLHNWGAANYALDTTHPAALDWVVEVIETAVREWGFEYLKLDFLYAAALRGQRTDSSITSVEAYRRGMARVRAAAGADTFVLGCGAPLLPSVGMVDGMRIGSDVAAYWGEEGNSDGPALLNALRATLARGWLHGQWWANDPDCVVLRVQDSALTDSEVEAWAAVVALSGGMVFVGDDLSQVAPERLALLGRLLPPSGQAAEVSPPLVNRLSERLHLRVRRPWGSWSVLGVANWRDVPVAATFDPRVWGLTEDAYHLVDQCAGTYLGRVTGAIDLGTLQPHALRLVAAHPDLGRPKVIGSTGHLLGDVVDLAEEHWDPARAELTLLATRHAPPGRRADFLIGTPGGDVRHVSFSSSSPGPHTLRFP